MCPSLEHNEDFFSQRRFALKLIGVFTESFGLQGRRRAFKSGPAEDVNECRRHERGEHEGGLEGLPREKF